MPESSPANTVPSTETDAADETVRVLGQAVFHAHDAVMITDAVLEAPGPHIVYVNPAFERMSGWSAAEMATLTPRVLQGPETDRETLQRLREALKSGSPFQGSAVNYRRDGSPFVMEWSISAVTDAHGDPTHFVAIQRDVTAFRRRLADAEEGARTDALTGLANRRAYDMRLASMLAEPDASVGLLALDLDRFKSVNDTHGHGAGDAVLVEVGRRMSAIAAAIPRALLARTGGEEFSLLVADPDDKNEMVSIAESVRTAVTVRPVETGAVALDVTVSIGATVAGPPVGADRLAVAADRALYRAKEAGRNRVEFEASADAVAVS